MKRQFSLILVVLLFLLGIGIFSYPFIASYLYQKNALVVKVEYAEAVNGRSEEELQAILDGAREYNEALLSAGLILTEPFDPDRYDIDAMYMKLPTESPEIGYVSIASLDLTLPIYHTTTNEVLGLGAGHIPHTSLPIGGESTHAAISAHRGLPNAEMFTNLDRLQRGNLFRIEILGMTLTYQVDRIVTVEPDEVEYLTIEPGEDYVTLITCTPIGINTHRLLVRGHRVANEDIAEVMESEPEVSRKLGYTDYVVILAGLLVLVFIVVLVRAVLLNRKRDDDAKTC